MVNVYVQEEARISRIEPYVQPLVRLNGEDDDIFHFEVLSRFYDEQGKYIAPNKIFGHKGNRNVFYKLDKQILRTSCEQYERLKEACPNQNFKMGINVSEVSVARIEDYVDFAWQEVQGSSLSPEQVSLEVNEKAKEGMSEFTEYASSKKFGISVDDLGAQNNTFGKTKFEIIPYLADSAELTVKLDQSLIKNLFTEGYPYKDTDNTFIETALALQRDFPCITLVAEGIETEEMSDFLRAKGIDFGQGYYYGRPMTFKEYADWLKKHYFS